MIKGKLRFSFLLLLFITLKPKRCIFYVLSSSDTIFLQSVLRLQVCYAVFILFVSLLGNCQQHIQKFHKIQKLHKTQIQKKRETHKIPET